jgi:hypothetical protein
MRSWTPSHPCDMDNYGLVYVGVFFLVVLTTGLAGLGLFLIWRRGYVRGWRASQVHDPCCPKCGYNLTGLTHCRCPECGFEFSLDKLGSFVPGRGSGG